MKGMPDFSHGTLTSNGLLESSTPRLDETSTFDIHSGTDVALPS
jgi:hypothetical protein